MSLVVKIRCDACGNESLVGTHDREINLDKKGVVVAAIKSTEEKLKSVNWHFNGGTAYCSDCVRTGRMARQ